MNSNLRSVVFKTLRIFGWTLSSLLLVLVIIILAIRTPYVQNKLIQKAIGFLETKIGSKVTLESIYIGFPKKIVLEGFYAEDLKSDTLVYLDKLSVDTDLWGLTNNRIHLNSIDLSNATAKINRTKSDSSFNFDYIIKAFVPPETSQDTTSASWDFTIGDISLNNVAIDLKDQFGKNYVNAKIGKLDVSLEESNFNKSSFVFSDLALSSSTAQISTGQGSQSVDTNEQSGSTPINIDFDKIQINNVRVNYEQPDVNQVLHINLTDFIVEANKIDLGNQTIDLKRAELSNSFISFRQGEMSIPDSSKEEIDPAPAWSIKLKELILKENGFQYDNAAERVSSFDQNHIWILTSQVMANNVEIDGNDYKAQIGEFSFKEKSGVEVKSLKSQFVISDSQFILKGFDFRTTNSRLAVEATISYDRASDNKIDYNSSKINVDVKDSFIALKDVLFFAPNLFDSLPINIPKHEKIFLNTQLHGSVNDVTIDSFYAQLLDSTIVDFIVSIKGLPDFNHSYLNLKLNRLYTTRADVMHVLHDSMISSLELPRWINATGDFDGTLKASKVNILLQSDLGTIDASGNYDLTLHDSYDFRVTTKNLQVGKLIKQDAIDTLDLTVEVKGSGLTLETLDASVKANVDRFKYNGYNYVDFELQGSFQKFLFSGSASLEDKNLDFVLNADLDYSADVAHYKATFNLKNADFKALKLSQRPLRARATLDVDLGMNELSRVNGDIGIRKVAIYDGESLYKVDSLLVVSIDQEGESSISIRSDIVEGDFKGTFSVGEIPKTIRQHLNQYFSMQDTTVHAFAKPQNFEFDLTLKNTDLLTDIILPDLKSFVPGKIEGKFDSEQNLLMMNIGVTKVKYGSMGVDSLLVEVDSDKKTFNYKIRLKNLEFDTLHVAAMQLKGELANNELQTELTILDAANEEKYRIAGALNSLENGFKFSLVQDQLLLNYKDWLIPATNSLTFKNKTIQTRDFTLTQGNEKFEMVTDESDSSFAFRFNQFELENLTNLVEGVIPASGRLNGDLKFMNSTKGEFSSKLMIDELMLLEKPWGKVNILIAHTEARYTFDVSVDGKNIDLTSKGYYVNTESNSEVSLTLNLASLNLELLEPLSFGQLKDVKGKGEGKLEVKSIGPAFSIRGEMLFSDAEFTSTYLKNSFSLKRERILFNNEGIVFDNFKIADAHSNQAIVKGAIKTKEYKEFVFDLRASMKRFQLLNTKEGDNELYYGLVKVDAEAKITGTPSHPKVDLELTLEDETNLTYIIPESEKTAQEIKGIVRFVDYDSNLDPFLANLSELDTAKTLFKGLDLSANLDLGDKALLNIVLDPRTGDKLSVNGNASLVLNMDASGGLDLSGRYEITQGTYNFSFQNLAKREFNLEKGSTLEWTGDPMNATMDITASYQLDASPLELVYNQINTSNQSEINNYNQRLPFIVYLIISGRLLEPQISFKLDMPEDKRNAFGGAIYAKLLDINTRESDLNKQVFSLIILKRFMADNPLESQSASSISNTARQSVSRILSDQLNRLSENIKGVELTFDIKSYESFSGTEVQGETKAQLGVSKNVFDDRLVVKLSGNVDLEGGDGQSEVTDYIGDIALEYKLTSDGRFRVTGFRNSNFDIIDGELVETGAGLIYIKDYNTLRELFKSNAKRK